MFAQLGDITFNLITYLDALDESSKYTFAEHQTIEGKPKLQYIGDELDELNIKLSFHSMFCLPEYEIKKLKDAAKMHKELPFILGSGKYVGKFVILEISSITQHSDRIGNIISIETQVELKEWNDSGVKVTQKDKKKTTKKKQTKTTSKRTAKTPKQIVRQE